MKLIHYFSEEIINDKIVENEQDEENKYEILAKTYKINDKDFEYWRDVIQKTYGQYGEITTEDIEDEKTDAEIISKTINNLVVDNKEKDLVISQMAKQINDLNIKTKEGQNV